ncbi:hypothetical protein, partial [Mycobacterium kansasii]|uniref:hypothetical protein n=1 Tax=Mycobacterium kansasii TaxID=1768 RepID=UPI0028060420
RRPTRYQQHIPLRHSRFGRRQRRSGTAEAVPADEESARPASASYSADSIGCGTTTTGFRQ